MTRVLCCGIATIDYIFAVAAIPTTPTKHRARDMVITGGGLAGNAAVAAARLGARTTLASRIGDDLTGQGILAGLSGENVEIGLVRVVAGRRSPVSSVFVDAAGERLVVSYADPAMPVEPNWIDPSVIAAQDAVHADTRWPEGALHVFAAARRAGKPSVLDVDRAPTNPAIIEAVSHAGFSAPALREWTGHDDLALGLQEAGRRIAGTRHLVTDGANGVLLLDQTEVLHVSAPTVTAVDTLGAGDAWHGALAVALGEGRPLLSAVAFANAAAAIKCTRFGGREGMARRDEVDRLLAGSFPP